MMNDYCENLEGTICLNKTYGSLSTTYRDSDWWDSGLFALFPRHFANGFGFWFWQRSAGGRAGNGTDRGGVFLIVENSLGQLPGFYGDLGCDELGHIIHSDQRIIEGRVFLRQDKGFVRGSCFIYIAEIGPGEQTAASFTAEGNPSAVAGPTVPRLGILAVDRELLIRPCAQIHEIQVTARLVDGKAAIGAHTEQ